MSLEHLARLRQATSNEHQRLEQLPALQYLTSEQVSLVHYGKLLEAFFHLHQSLEKKLLPFFQALGMDAFDFNSWLASPRLAQDLVQLHRTLPEPLPLPDTPEIHCLPQALGCTYVLLGAGFGAYTLVPHLKQQLGDGIPLHYYTGSWPFLKSLWQQLDQLIGLYCQLPTDQQIACQMAIDTFRFFQQHLALLHPASTETLEKQP